MQPYLKSKSTSFMFNKNFCEMKGKKGIHWTRGGWGNGGAVQIASWKCNFSIYLDIQVYYLDIKEITTLLGLLWFFMRCFLLFIHVSTLQPLSWKVTFSGTQKSLQRTVCNLQASDWLLCEDETGAHYQLHRLTYKLWTLFFFLI